MMEEDDDAAVEIVSLDDAEDDDDDDDDDEITTSDDVTDDDIPDDIPDVELDDDDDDDAADDDIFLDEDDDDDTPIPGVIPKKIRRRSLIVCLEISGRVWQLRPARWKQIASKPISALDSNFNGRYAKRPAEERLTLFTRPSRNCLP